MIWFTRTSDRHGDGEKNYSNHALHYAMYYYIVNRQAEVAWLAMEPGFVIEDWGSDRQARQAGRDVPTSP